MNDFISKTDHLGKPDLIKPDAKKNTFVPKTDNAFNQILSEQIRSEQIKEALPAGEQKLSGLSEIQSPLKTLFTDTDFNADKYTRKLETSLDLLEVYAAVLDHPDKTLKQASELLDQILDQMQGLEREFKTSNVSDPDLNQILTQVLTTVTLEKIKLDRGDYLN